LNNGVIESFCQEPPNLHHDRAAVIFRPSLGCVRRPAVAIQQACSAPPTAAYLEMQR